MWSSARRDERAVADEYRAIVSQAIASLNGCNHPAAITLAMLPENLRGFGKIRRQAAAHMRAQASTIQASMAAQGH